MRILVVEDQKTVGMALCQILDRLGHENRLVIGGDAAWDAVEREDWRLILTDWIMPDVDGLELCRRIRGRHDGIYRYVIMLTVRSERADRLEGLGAGADDFLTKPVDEEELIIRLAIAERILAVQSELEESNSRLSEMATTDPLTGLANRRMLNELMAGVPSFLAPGKPCSVISLDIDHFKSYNDAFGHVAGDEVLRAVARLLADGTRAGDLVARTGGEEFLIVLPGRGPVEALGVAERLRSRIAGHGWPARPVTASFGVATLSGSMWEARKARILDEADRALYHSKRSGRNRVTHALSIADETAGRSPGTAHGVLLATR